jgi:outer membrane scaffolding protein for murein synthesis (MipA/OmpV family)
VKELVKYWCGFLCCFSASTAWAQADVEQGQFIKKSTLHASVSLGFGGIENPVLDAENLTTPILPSLSYYGEDWYFNDFSLGYSLYETPTYYIDLLGRFNDDGFFFELDGVDKLLASGAITAGPGVPTIPSATPINLTPIQRDISYMAGFSGALNLYQGLWVNTAVLQDVTKVHDGHEVFVNLYSDFEFDYGKVGIELGANYKNRELIEYYYTVAPKESKTRLRKYALQSNINYHVKLTYEYVISERFSFDFSLKHTWLGSNLANSHMISKNGYFSGFTGITYHF